MGTDRGIIGGLLAALVLALLAACQTVPPTTGFTKEQVAVLEARGFHEVDGNYELGLDNRVLFGFDSSALHADVAPMLSDLVGALTGVGVFGAEVEGHTDSQGATEYNQALSERRAEAVKQGLVTAGMAADRVRARGLGETDPVATNDTDEGRQQNRRVVIVVSPADALPLR